MDGPFFRFLLLIFSKLKTDGSGARSWAIPELVVSTSLPVKGADTAGFGVDIDDDADSIKTGNPEAGSNPARLAVVSVGHGSMGGVGGNEDLAEEQCSGMKEGLTSPHCIDELLLL